MKLPNGYGSVTKLSGKRRKPYIVRVTTGWHYDPEKDRQVQDSVIIGYAKTKAEGLKMLADYNGAPFDVEKINMTFEQVWAKFKEYKFKGVTRSASYYSYNSAYSHCSKLYPKKFSALRREDLQDVIDNCERGKKASREKIKVLFTQMYKFAIMEDICLKDYSKYVTVSGEEDETGEPFSEDAIAALWALKDDSDVQVILMLIYSGIRITELKIVQIDPSEGTIYGGVKNSASKNRLAPIHESTLAFWKSFGQSSFDPSDFRNKRFYPVMEKIGFESENGKKHTPHDCRHTFSWLADKYGMDETCKHMIMGHKIPGDVEQTTYRHRSMEQLKEEMQKIKTPEGLLHT